MNHSYRYRTRILNNPSDFTTSYADEKRLSDRLVAAEDALGFAYRIHFEPECRDLDEEINGLKEAMVAWASTIISDPDVHPGTLLRRFAKRVETLRKFPK